MSTGWLNAESIQNIKDLWVFFLAILFFATCFIPAHMQKKGKELSFVQSCLLAIVAGGSFVMLIISALLRSPLI